MAKDTPVPDDARSKTKPDAKPEARASAKPDAKIVAKPEAKGKADAGAQAGEAQPANKPSRGLLYAMLGLLVVTAAGALAYQQFSVDAPATVTDASKADAAKPAAPMADEAKPAAPKADPSKPPQFVALEPFTVNLRTDGNSDHLLQVGLTFQVSGIPVADAMKQHMPVLRSNILLLLTSKSPGELVTVDGKGKLGGELLATVRQTLPGEDPEKGVSAVHYSAFIIQ